MSAKSLGEHAHPSHAQALGHDEQIIFFRTGQLLDDLLVEGEDRIVFPTPG